MLPLRSTGGRLISRLRPDEGKSELPPPGAEEGSPLFPQPRHWRADSEAGPGMALRQGGIRPYAMGNIRYAACGDEATDGNSSGPAKSPQLPSAREPVTHAQGGGLAEGKGRSGPAREAASLPDNGERAFLRSRNRKREKGANLSGYTTQRLADVEGLRIVPNGQSCQTTHDYRRPKHFFFLSRNLSFWGVCQKERSE